MVEQEKNVTVEYGSKDLKEILEEYLKQKYLETLKQE